MKHYLKSVLRKSNAREFYYNYQLVKQRTPSFNGKLGALRYLYRNFPHYLRGAPDRYPIPPADLIHQVTPAFDIRSFLTSGADTAADFLARVEKHDVKEKHLKSILDFGCGCGRVLRGFTLLKLPSLELHGSDYNPKLIAWCNANLPFAKFEVNRLSPPLPYAASKFDFVYALSVFTHLPVSLQFEWIEEMARILKPRAYLLITTSGEAYLNHLSEAEKERFRGGLVVVKEEEKAGANGCNAWHPPSFVKQHLAKGFEVVEMELSEQVPDTMEVAEKAQDTYLMRKL
jgi:SAM-dependent methyltransferase